MPYDGQVIFLNKKVDSACFLLFFIIFAIIKCDFALLKYYKD